MTPDEIQSAAEAVYLCDGSDFDRNFPVLISSLGDWPIENLFVLSGHFLLSGMPNVARAIAEYADKCWQVSYRKEPRPDPALFIPVACEFWQQDEAYCARLRGEAAGTA